MNLKPNIARMLLQELLDAVGDDFTNFNDEQVKTLTALAKWNTKKRGQPTKADRDAWLVAEAEEVLASDAMSFANACRIVIERDGVEPYFRITSDTGFYLMRERVAKRSQ